VSVGRVCGAGLSTGLLEVQQNLDLAPAEKDHREDQHACTHS
jgi:hypothetical protein